MTNSRAKGAKGERAFANLLKDAGLVARRGQQFRGGPDSPDVICDSLPSLHFEVKVREKHNIWEWMTQAAGEMGEGQTPIVAIKKNRQPWLVAMRYEDWIEWAKDRRDELQAQKRSARVQDLPARAPWRKGH